MDKRTYKKIEEIIINIYAPDCPPKANSEYHLGFQAAQVGYAESKLRTLKSLEALLSPDK